MGRIDILTGGTVKWTYTYTSGRLASVTKNGSRACSAVDDQDRLVNNVLFLKLPEFWLGGNKK